MTATFTPEYLERLATIKTPSEIPVGVLSDSQYFFYDYCELRNAAKDLLTDKEDKTSRDKLSRLVKKLKIE